MEFNIEAITNAICNEPLTTDEIKNISEKEKLLDVLFLCRIKSNENNINDIIGELLNKSNELNCNAELKTILANLFITKKPDDTGQTQNIPQLNNDCNLFDEKGKLIRNNLADNLFNYHNKIGYPYKLVKTEDTVNIYKYQPQGYYKSVSNSDICKSACDLLKECGSGASYNNDLGQEVYKRFITTFDTIPESDFASNENLVNFNNGILNIRNNNFETPSTRMFENFTYILPTDYLSVSREPKLFLNFLDMLTDGDEEAKTFLLQYGGAVLSNVKGYSYKTLPILYGKSNTGKSQYINILVELLGSENSTPFESIANIENDKFALANFIDKRLAYCPDMPPEYLTKVNKFKTLTGGDIISVERKYQNPFKFRYNGFIICATNELPRLSTNIRELFDRLVIINCPKPVPPEQRNPNLVRDILNNEKDDVAKLFIDTFKGTLINGKFCFTIPTSSIDTVDDYKSDYPSVAFYKECCKPPLKQNGKYVIADKNYTTSKVYSIYKTFCNVNGYKSCSIKKFAEEIADYLNIDKQELTRKLNNGNFYIFSLCLNEEQKEAYGIYDRATSSGAEMYY